VNETDPTALISRRSFGPRFSFRRPQAQARIGAPFFGGRDPPHHRFAEQLLLQVPAFRDHRGFAGVENGPVGRRQRQLLHLFRHRQRAPYHPLVLGVHFDQDLGAHRTSLSRGREVSGPCIT
jgi:hypothetical protein